MSMVIEWLERRLSAYPQLRPWVWFVLLWCAGLGFVLAISYPIKWLMMAQ